MFLELLTFITTEVCVQWRSQQWIDHVWEKQKETDSVHKILKQKHKYLPKCKIQTLAEAGIWRPYLYPDQHI